MAKIDFKEVFDTLKKEVKDLAVSTVKSHADEAKADGLSVIRNMEENLKRWGTLFVNGDLTKEDVEFLVLAQKELIEMKGLKNAGLSKIKLDEFKGKLLGIVTDTITGLIKI